MRDFDLLIEAKNNLFTSLGDKSQTYLDIMKKWFSLNIDKSELEYNVKRILSPQQWLMHVKLFLCLDLMDKSTSPNTALSKLNGSSKSDKHVRKKQRTSSDSTKKLYSTTFQIATINKFSDESLYMAGFDMEQLESAICVDKHRSFMDEYMLFGRLTVAAWSMALDGAQYDAAQVLSIAVKNFIKNFLTDVISQRSGFKLRKTFMYGLGSSLPNPWINSNPETYEPCFWNDPYYFGVHGPSPSGLKQIEEDQTGDKICVRKNTCVQQSGTNSENDTQLEIASKVPNAFSASTVVNNNRPRVRHTITAQEVMNAVIVHRSCMFSRSLYFICMESLIAFKKHPSWGDVERE